MRSPAGNNDVNRGTRLPFSALTRRDLAATSFGSRYSRFVTGRGLEPFRSHPD
jgi:hypothetical protein